MTQINKKVLAGLFLAVGSTITIAFAYSIATADPETRSSRLVGGLLFGVPPIALGSWLLYHSPSHPLTADQISLRSTFYRLLRENNGYLTLSQFAQTARLPRALAQSYLDERAKEFDAKFAVSNDGGLAYQFYSQNQERAYLTETLREQLANSDFKDTTVI